MLRDIKYSYSVGSDVFFKFYFEGCIWEKYDIVINEDLIFLVF